MTSPKRLWLVPGLVALALAACSEPRQSGGGGGTGGGTGGSGGSGPCGDGAFGETTIYDLQNPLCAPAPKTEVVLEGVVVTAVVAYDGVGQHFFVQDPTGGKYSGIYIRNGATGPVVDAPAVGDVVELAGVYDEYFERSQIEVLSLTKTGTAEVPAPADVDPEAIATRGEEQEAWEGVLVRVADVKVTDAFVRDAKGQERGNWRVNLATREAGGVLVGTMMGRDFYVREPADTFTSIVGVLDYGFEESKLEPRSAEDITFTDGTHPRLTDAGERTVYELQDSWSERHPHAPASVTVKDVVVTANAGSRIWVQELGGGAYSGIQVRLSEGAESPAVGSKVTVTGVYTEYYSNAQIDTAVVETTGAVDAPALQLVTPADLVTGNAEAEQWEGVPVEVRNVRNVEFQVKGTDNTWRGDFRIAPIEGGGTGGGAIVGRLFADDYLSDPDDDQPDEFLSIAGILDYSFSEYRLETRGNEDLTFLDGSHPTVPDVGVVTVPQLQDAERTDFAGTNVFATLEDVVVTASSSQGFFVQEASGEKKFSGLYVRMPPAEVGLVAPAQGAQVTVAGKVFEYYGKTQMVAAAIESTGAGTIPSPAVVDAVAIATGGAEQEAYEGVLVEVRDVVNVQDPVNGTDGNDRGDFRVGPAGGTEGVIVGHLFADDYETGAVGDAFDSVIGVMDYSFDEARLETRGNADITFDDGTHPAPPEATAKTVRQIQDENAEGHAPEGEQVRLEGVVVVGAARYGFFVADPAGGPWSGVYVNLPPGSALTVPAKGKLVNVEGTVDDYYGNTQVDASAIEVGADGTIPAPIVVTPDEIATGGARAEELEGVLVEVQGVENTQDPVNGSDGNDRGDFRVQTAGGTGGVIVGHFMPTDYAGTVGDGFESIVGVMAFSFDESRLEPRGNEDITLADGTHPGPVTATVHDVQSGAAGAAPLAVVIEDVVVTAVAPNGSFFVADQAGGAYAGIYAYKPSSVTLPALAVGDVVSIEGIYKEYYGLSEIEVGAVTASGATAALPAPAVLTPDELTDPATAEAWEGCLVQVSNVQVTEADVLENGQDRGAFRVQTVPGDGTAADDLLVDDLIHRHAETLGATFATVTGLLDYSFSSYRLLPRGDVDLVVQP